MISYMTQVKTEAKKLTAAAYIKTLDDLKQRKEAKELLTLFKEVTKTKPVMWGNMFGFGSYHYKYESGREGDCLATGFAMRKSGPTLYIMPGYVDYKDIIKDLGPHKLGKSCLYLKSLDGVNLNLIKKLIKAGLKDLKKTYPVTM